MKKSVKKQLQDLLAGPGKQDKPLHISFDGEVPKDFKGSVIKFVDFAQRNKLLEGEHIHLTNDEIKRISEQLESEC